MTALSVDRLGEVGRGVLARVLIGELARLDTIPSSIFSRELAAVWSAASGLLRTDGEVDPVALMSCANLNPEAVAALVGADERHLIPSAAAGVDKLAEYLRRAKVAELAESFRERFLDGDGEATWTQLLVAHEAAVRKPTASERDDLADWRSADELAWEVPNFAVANGVILLSGRPGLYKSFVLLLLAILRAAGHRGPWLDHHVLADDPIPVLKFDFENGQARRRQRIRALVAGGLSADVVDRAIPNLIVPRSINPAAFLERELPALLRLHRPRLLTLDPLRPFLVGLSKSDNPENDNSAAGAFLDGLRAALEPYNCTAIVADHDSKSGEAARGASAKRDAVDALWHLESPSRGALRFTPEKCRDGGLETFHVGVRTEGPAVSFHRTEATAETTEANTSNDLAAVRQAIEAHHARTGSGFSERSISETTGIPKTNVHRIAEKLIGQGVLYRPSERSGLYPVSVKP